MREGLSPEPALYVVAASSGRALACSALRGGYHVHVVDGYADADTRRAAAGSVQLIRTPDLHPDQLGAEAVDAVRSLEPLRGIVYGSGFEGCPDLLEALATVAPLCGNDPGLVRRLKQPEKLAEVLAAAGIEHPEFTRFRPPDPDGWLCKRIGGAGGIHVRTALDAETAGADEYFQRRVPGSAVSALFLANGRNARVVGFHEQWFEGADPARPFIYGGACTAHGVAAPTISVMTAAIERLVRRVGLRGLNGVDFVVCGDRFVVIEVNPRPCITLDLYDADWPGGLFHWHLLACSGHLPVHVPARHRIRAHRLLYAPVDILVAPGVVWPEWVSDQPAGAQQIPRGSPVCTIQAEGMHAAEVLGLTVQRSAWLLDRLGVGQDTTEHKRKHEITLTSDGKNG